MLRALNFYVSTGVASIHCKHRGTENSLHLTVGQQLPLYSNRQIVWSLKGLSLGQYKFEHHSLRSECFSLLLFVCPSLA